MRATLKCLDISKSRKLATQTRLFVDKNKTQNRRFCDYVMHYSVPVRRVGGKLQVMTIDSPPVLGLL